MTVRADFDRERQSTTLSRLRAHKASQRHPCLWIFANPGSGLPWAHQTLSRRAPAICKAADVPIIQPKDMRATCATNLLDQGVPLPRVSSLLGHSSVAVTATFYQRTMRHQQERVERLAESYDEAHERAAESARGGAPHSIRRAE